MKRLEKLAIILIALWVIQAILTGLAPALFKQIIKSESITTLQLLTASVAGLSTLMISATCGIWLYSEAKRESRPHWVWCLAGLIFKIPAIIVFLAYIILDEIRNKNSNQPSEEMAVSGLKNQD